MEKRACIRKINKRNVNPTLHPRIIQANHDTYSAVVLQYQLEKASSLHRLGTVSELYSDCSGSHCTQYLIGIIEQLDK
jgi:hypothetical protein